jgi:hypothetical protein
MRNIKREDTYRLKMPRGPQHLWQRGLEYSHQFRRECSPHKSIHWDLLGVREQSLEEHETEEFDEHRLTGLHYRR